MNNLINDFLKKENVFAVVGVSRNPAKYGHQVYKDLGKKTEELFIDALKEKDRD